MKQSHYIEDNPCTSSIYNQRLLDPVVPHEPIFDDNFAQQIDTLGYLRHTRPDVCVALGVSAQFAKKGRHGPQSTLPRSPQHHVILPSNN